MKMSEDLKNFLTIAIGALLFDGAVILALTVTGYFVKLCFMLV